MFEPVINTYIEASDDSKSINYKPLGEPDKGWKGLKGECDFMTFRENRRDETRRDETLIVLLTSIISVR